MKNQEQYDRALALLEELEEILGEGSLTVDGYDGYDPRNELWRKFATEEELAEKRERERKHWEEWAAKRSGTPFGDISARTAAWAESQLLEHAEPLVLLEKFAGARPMPAASETIKFRRGEGEADSP